MWYRLTFCLCVIQDGALRDIVHINFHCVIAEEKNNNIPFYLLARCTMYCTFLYLPVQEIFIYQI
jgi:hypothetical protein